MHPCVRVAGFGSAWHLGHIEVEDCGTGQKYMFPCNRWLSMSDDDNQVCRELSCANLSSPGTKEKIGGSQMSLCVYS